MLNALRLFFIVLAGVFVALDYFTGSDTNIHQLWCIVISLNFWVWRLERGE